MKRAQWLPMVAMLLAFTPAVVAPAVVAPAQTANTKQTSVPASIVQFDRVWAAATPQNYTITVTSTGKTHYVSRNPTQPPDANGLRDDDYSLEFTISPAGRDKIFSLAEQAGYFNGDFDYKHRMANTGKKTLSYTDATRKFETSYNWSENPAIAELTRFFEGISGTVEHGRKLQFLYRFDKLGLDAELKGMEDMEHSRYLAELQLIAPTLEKLAADTSVLHMARQRAQRLLALSNKDETAKGAKPAR